MLQQFLFRQIFSIFFNISATMLICCWVFLPPNCHQTNYLTRHFLELLTMFFLIPALPSYLPTWSLLTINVHDCLFLWLQHHPGQGKLSLCILLRYVLRLSLISKCWNPTVWFAFWVYIFSVRCFNNEVHVHLNNTVQTFHPVAIFVSFCCLDWKKNWVVTYMWSAVSQDCEDHPALYPLSR